MLCLGGALCCSASMSLDCYVRIRIASLSRGYKASGSGTSKAKVLREIVIVVIFAEICTWPVSSGAYFLLLSCRE